MPILAIEPDIYPANLLDLHDFIEFLPKDSGVAWWVLYTRARQEKAWRVICYAARSDFTCRLCAADS